MTKKISNPPPTPHRPKAPPSPPPLGRCVDSSLIEKLEALDRNGDDTGLIHIESVKAIVRQHEAESIKHATGESDNKPIWEEITEESDKHHESLKSLPTDLSSDHDHYIYGTPKRDAQSATGESTAAISNVRGITMLIDKPGLYELKASYVSKSGDTLTVEEHPTLVASGSIGSPVKYTDGTYSREYEEHEPVRDVKPGTLPIDIPATLEALHTQYQFRSDAIVPRASKEAPTLEQIGMIRDAHLNLIPILKEIRRLQKIEWCVKERGIDLTRKPEPVSLEKCAGALNAMIVPETFTAGDLAKAVLEAAGVAYVV